MTTLDKEDILCRFDKNQKIKQLAGENMDELVQNVYKYLYDMRWDFGSTHISTIAVRCAANSQLEFVERILESLDELDNKISISDHIQSFYTQKNLELCSALEQIKSNTDLKCKACGAQNGYTWSVQTRAADEATTNYYLCLTCKVKSRYG
jgi:DNA-directed RNA polymerase subunit M/transcription elongation factor TFIIS